MEREQKANKALAAAYRNLKFVETSLKQVSSSGDVDEETNSTIAELVGDLEYVSSILKMLV